ncbi:helix-turn-helix transcriptional regulator [Actinomycetospora termitidis]|uniref:LuxR C-terminal-related transcriptional regulator n=1 Tax=Actinomycetospora termitidis TaxID=3053470 RepID=A0ABT7MI80_9PSEU|nr:LuxR C-terminal-related transcriptional regulator [Actinomycetospora sp. Odt1-22]MDL5160389.1 LuxR C-terminal-related transcriptional regulator [Actinomycetospora sp. Odt1-22]
MLPAYASSFVGRDDDVRDLAGLVGRTRVVTLVGPGGSGKTRLAVEVARVVGGAVGGVVGFVEAGAPADLALVALRAVGVREDPDASPEDRLVASLTDRHGLLVIDGCEHVRSAAAVLVGRLVRGCPDLRVLTTSRVRLGLVGETVRAVGRLPDDGRALFVERAREVRGDLRPDDSTVADICRLAEGLPLAVELAAGHARGLSLAAIRDGMTDRLRFPVSADSGLPARHRSLQACIAWGLDAAGERAAQALAALSVLPGRFTLETARAATGEPAAVLETLVDHSLVMFDPADARYRLLDTVREHAAELLPDDGSVTDRLRAWVAELAGELADGLGRADPDALDRLDREAVAVVAVLRDAAASGHGLDEAAGIVVDLAFGWSLRGRCHEGRDLARGVAEALPEVPPRLGWALAFLTAYAGDLATGVELAAGVADRAEGATRGRALTLVGMAQLFVDPAGAIAVLAEAVELGGRAGDDWGEVEARQLLAYCHLQQCADAEAVGWADSARPALGRLGHAQLRAWDAAIRAEVAVRAGRLVDGEAVGRDGLRLALGVAEPVSAAACLLPLVRALCARGRPDDGSALVGEVRPFFEEHPGIGTALVVELADAVAGAWSEPPRPVPPALRDAAAGLPALGAEVALLHATLAFDGAAATEAGELAASIGHRELGAAAGLVRAAVAGAGAHAALAEAAAAGCELLVPDALDVVARGALRAGRVTVAATLHAAADHRREELGLAVSPLGRAVRSDRDAAVAALPVATLAECTERGRRLDRDGAVAYASRTRGRRDRPSSGWESLTPTEREVVGLVGKGLTNAAVGAALLVSAGTVRTHLRSVFGKLGVSSRVELAALAARRRE